MRTLIRTAALAAALLSLAPAAAAAQTQTPEQAARAYFQHLRAGDISAIAQAMHPAALQSLKDSLMPLVAEISARHGGGEGPMGMDAGAMGALAPDALYQLMLMGLFSEIDLQAAQGALDIRPLGTLPAGPDLAHVVYAVTLPVAGHGVEMKQVLTMRRHEGAWKVDSGTGISALVNSGLLPLLFSAAVAEELGGDDDEDEDDDGGR
ncbi:MAG TPA: hypothetical protein VFQ45_06295 [Longimicrobium sp.]|nr:hypothetical protein [Longimicrobium sp.]